MFKNAKKLILPFLIVILMAFLVSAATLNLEDSTGTLSGNVSDTLTGNFTVSSTQDLSFVVFEASDLVAGTERMYATDVSFNPIRFDSMTAGQNYTAEFSLTIPANQKANDYAGVITIRENADPLNKVEFPLTVTVDVTRGFTLNKSEPSIVQGFSDKLLVGIQNTGNADTVYEYIFSDFTKGTDTLSFTGTVGGVTGVDYEGTTDLELTFDVPIDKPTGTYTGTVDVCIQGDCAATKQTQALNVVVTAAQQSVNVVETQAGSAVVEGSEPTQLVSSQPAKLNVTNNGNVDLANVQITLPDLTSGSHTIPSSKLSLDANNFALAEDASRELTLTVDPTSREAGTYTGNLLFELGNANVTYPFTYVVSQANTDASVEVTAGGAVIVREETRILTNTNTQLKVTNTGNIAVDTVTVTKSDLVSGANTIPASQVSLTQSFALALAEEKTMSVSVSPANDQAAGTYTGTFTFDLDGIKNVTAPVTYVVSDAVTDVTLPDVQFDQATRNTTVTKAVTVTNSGDYTLSGIVLSSTNSAVALSGCGVTQLAAGASCELTLQYTIPETAAGGVQDIGDLKFVSDQINKSSDIKINVDAESMLEIKKVKVRFGDSSETETSDGKTLSKKAAPGDTVDIEVDVENMFDENTDDIDMDVELEVTIKDVGNDGDDILSKNIDFNLNAEQKKTKSVDWDDDNEIDKAADSGEHDIIITVRGTDDNGQVHEDEWTLTFEVERENDPDPVLTRVDISPSSIRPGQSFTIYVEGENQGEDSSNNALLEIENDNLGISVIEDFELGAYDDDDCDAIDEPDEGCREFDYSKSIFVPAGTDPGTYPITVKFIYDRNRLGDSETVSLVVQGDSTDTGDSTGTDSDNAGTSTGTTSTGIDVQYASGSAPSSTGAVFASDTTVTDTEDVEGMSTTKLALLIISNLVVIGLIIWSVSALVRR